MNKNLLWFELIKLDTRIWIEALGIQGYGEGYLRGGGGVGWVITRFGMMFFDDFCPMILWCYFRWWEVMPSTTLWSIYL